MPEKPLIEINDYVHNEGSVCPACHTDDSEDKPFQYEQPTIESGQVEQQVTCSNCKSVWADIHVLHGFRLIELAPQLSTAQELADRYAGSAGFPDYPKAAWIEAVQGGYENGYGQWLWEQINS
jgi:hypothetical protein